MVLSEVIDRCNKLLASGRNRDEIITYMHSKGLTIIESIKIYREIYKVTLGTAKEDVASANCWKKIAKHGDALHTLILEKIEGEEKGEE